MGNWQSKIDADAMRFGGRVIGGLLVGAAIFTSFFNAVPAGFLYVTGLGLLVVTFIDPERLESLTVSPSEVSVKLAKREIDQKVEQAETILTEIRAIEERLRQVQTNAFWAAMPQAHTDHLFGYVEIYKGAKDVPSDDKMFNDARLSLWGALAANFAIAFLGVDKDRTSVTALLKGPGHPVPRDELRRALLADGGDLQDAEDVFDAYVRFFEGEMPGPAVTKRIQELAVARSQPSVEGGSQASTEGEAA